MINQGNLLSFQTEKVNGTAEVEQKSHQGENNSCKPRWESHSSHVRSSTLKMPSDSFPPSPLDNKLMYDIARDFCRNSSSDSVEEAGCTVCGQLTSSLKLTRLKAVKQYLYILQAQGVTRVERKHSSKLIQEYKGPILNYRCDCICDDFWKHL